MTCYETFIVKYPEAYLDDLLSAIAVWFVKQQVSQDCHTDV